MLRSHYSLINVKVIHCLVQDLNAPYSIKRPYLIFQTKIVNLSLKIVAEKSESTFLFSTN